MPLTTYAGESSRAYLADLCAGLAPLGPGLLPVTERRMRRIGLLALAAGIVWFAPDCDGWDRGPALVRSLRALPIPLFVAFVFHLVAAFPTGRVRSRFTRGAVVAGYIAAGTVSVGRALFRDPFLDPFCWRNCIDNSLLVSAHPGLARPLDYAGTSEPKRELLLWEVVAHRIAAPQPRHDRATAVTMLATS
jgi:hypothetical protein